MAFESVQFRGKENVMKAYSLRAVDCWAIYQKNNLITKGEGEAELSDFLEMLQGSNAIYTLKIYEDIDNPKLIKEKTQADGSFSFRLGAMYEDEDGGGTLDRRMAMYEGVNKRNKLFERLDLLEEKINSIGAVPDEQPQTWETKLIGVLSDPDELRKYAEVFQMITGTQKNEPPQIFKPQLGKVGNTDAMSAAHQQPTQQQIDRLAAALNTLEQNDPKIIDHLEKLAKLSVEKPVKFKSLITMLETFL